MRGIFSLCFFLLLSLCLSMQLWAQQFRSQALAPEANIHEKKSIDELEQELLANKLENNAYAEQSTALFLARHFLDASPEKALDYYQRSLQGDGLSRFAKFDIYLELIQLQVQLKRFDQALASIKARRKLGAKDSSTLLLYEAQALLETGQKKAVVDILKRALSLEVRPKQRFLLRLRYLFYQADALSEAAAIQRQIIERFDQSLAAIKVLVNLYIKQQDYIQAADLLQLAWLDKKPLAESDIMQLAALYAKTHNAFSAAQLLQSAIDNDQLKPSETRLRQLMYYWLSAKELEAALKVMVTIIERDPRVDDWIFKAELEQRLSLWQAMKESVEQACAMHLPDEFVGKANLLLGIAELKLGNASKARRAFINATLQGGEIDSANQYLAFMQAKAIGQEELDNYKGLCTPSWAKAEDFSLVTPSFNDDFFSDDLANNESFDTFERVDYQVGRSREQRLVASFHNIAMLNLEKELLPQAMRLGLFIGKNGGQINGELHFLFAEPFKLGQEFIAFSMAFPVSRKPMMKGRYQLIHDKGFYAARATFEGAPKDLISFWANFHSSVLADGLKLTGRSRQLVLDAKQASKDYIKLSLQLELEETVSEGSEL